MNKLIHGEALEQLRKLKDNNDIRAIIIDPPYGIFGKGSFDMNKLRKKAGRLYTNEPEKYKEMEDWDKPLDWEEIGNILVDVIKDDNIPIIVFGNLLSSLDVLKMANKDLTYSHYLVWNKKTWSIGGVLNAYKPAEITELILVFYKATKNNVFGVDNPNRAYFKSILDYTNKLPKNMVNKFGGRVSHCFHTTGIQFSIPTEETYKDITETLDLYKWSGWKAYKELKAMDTTQGIAPRTFNKQNDEAREKNVLTFGKELSGFHPTQKPVNLLMYLIKLYTNEWDTILDFTMGSGSTGVAAIILKRNFIGIELDKKYFEIAKKRIKNIDLIEDNCVILNNMNDKKKKKGDHIKQLIFFDELVSDMSNEEIERLDQKQNETKKENPEG